MDSVWPANKKPCFKLWENINEEIFVKCFHDEAAYPNEEWDLSKEETIYRHRDSSADLDSLIVFLLSLKTEWILYIMAPVWAVFYSNEPF